MSYWLERRVSRDSFLRIGSNSGASVKVWVVGGDLVGRPSGRSGCCFVMFISEYSSLGGSTFKLIVKVSNDKIMMRFVRAREVIF